MKTLENYSFILRNILVGTIAFGISVLAPRAGGAMQVLPVILVAEGYPEGLLSGDGLTVIGYKHYPDFDYFLWSPNKPLRAVPIPDKGTNWHPPVFLNESGNVVAGSGIMKTNQTGAWTWRVGQGLRDIFGAQGKVGYANIGVSPDGAFVVRQVNFLEPQSTIYRDYENGYSEVWLQLNGPNETYVDGVTADASVLYGRAYSSYVHNFVPCWWDAAGHINFCTALATTPELEVVFADAHGHRIVGNIPLNPQSSDQPRQTVFYWNTDNGQVDQFLPPGWIDAWCLSLSPDGNIFCLEGTPYNWNGRTPFLHAIVDFSSSADAAKGYQDVDIWLKDHRYISEAEAHSKSVFIVDGFSNDNSVVIGNYDDVSGNYTSFRAVKPRLVAMPGNESLP